MEPLAEDARRRERRARRLVELAREEVRDARDPGVRGLGDDHVVAGGARAAAGCARPRRRCGSAGRARGRRSRAAKNGAASQVASLDLHALERRDGMERQRGRRRARAPADHQRLPRPGVQQHRDVRDELLRDHVLAAAAGVGLAVHRQEAAAGVAPRLRDGDDGLRAFPVEEQRALLPEPVPEPAAPGPGARSRRARSDGRPTTSARGPTASSAGRRSPAPRPGRRRARASASAARPRSRAARRARRPAAGRRTRDTAAAGRAPGTSHRSVASAAATAASVFHA